MPTPLSCPASPTVIVFDFETTGQSPKLGNRPIEIGAVRIEEGFIVDRFQALMHPGFPITRFIESLTGISNAMLASAPPCEEVMAEFADWIGDTPLVAHNVGFDRAFLDAELAQLGRERSNPLACTVLTSRRLYPGAPNHQLATLVRHLDLPTTGTFHRALADAEMTSYLWLAMCDRLIERYGLIEVHFALVQTLMRVARAKVDRFLGNIAQQQRTKPLLTGQDGANRDNR